MVREKRERFALTYSLAIDAARRSPREAVLVWFSALFALDASASPAEPYAPAQDETREREIVCQRPVSQSRI